MCRKIQNVEYLKLFVPSPEKFQDRPQAQYARPVRVDDSIEWEVERILEHRVTRQGVRYKVRWKDSDLEQWFQEEHLGNCKELVREYHEGKGLEVPKWATYEESPESSLHRRTENEIVEEPPASRRNQAGRNPVSRGKSPSGIKSNLSLAWCSAGGRVIGTPCSAADGLAAFALCCSWYFLQVRPCVFWGYGVVRGNGSRACVLVRLSVCAVIVVDGAFVLRAVVRVCAVVLLVDVVALLRCSRGSTERLCVRCVRCCRRRVVTLVGALMRCC